MPEVNQSHFYEYDIRHIDVECYINVSRRVLSAASLYRKSTECDWSISVSLYLSPPSPLLLSLAARWVQRREISSGWRGAGVWPEGPLDTDSVIVHSCHSAPPSLFFFSSPPLCGHPHLRGIPTTTPHHHRLPNEE